MKISTELFKGSALYQRAEPPPPFYRTFFWFRTGKKVPATLAHMMFLYSNT